ncbi:MAG: hypothetical protein FJ149_07820 [Euryarchaeota archaeon]|nr:hypothetical protein [Euryarchaeota archaeon]
MKAAASVRPGDIEGVVRFHGEVYRREWRYDRRFGEYVARGVSAFARSAGYRSVFLWTTSELGTARRLYEAAGFRRTARRPASHLWGRKNITQERYSLGLG